MDPKARIWACLGTTLAVSGVMVACGSDPGQTAGTTTPELTASVVFSGSGGASFTQSSLRVCGRRAEAASEGYRCSSSMADGCACLRFDDKGHAIDPKTGHEAVVTGLCPSDSAPAADWRFEYAMFPSTDCTGTPLNDGSHDFTCYDAHAFAKKENPNASVEPLHKGRNVNNVVCVTHNASKAWQFASCAELTTADDVASRLTRYDCGCYPTADHPTYATSSTLGSCGCPDALHPIPPGCTLSPTCDVICGPSDS